MRARVCLSLCLITHVADGEVQRAVGVRFFYLKPALNFQQLCATHLVLTKEHALTSTPAIVKSIQPTHISLLLDRNVPVRLLDPIF
jgi:hypothetical protein